MITTAVKKERERIKLEGKIEGKLEEKIEIAKNAKREGLPIDIIAKLTGLTKKDIEKL